jgi:hypothetical protein
MTIKHFALALILAAASTSAARSANPMILLDQSDLSQLAVVDVTGDGNRLAIVQTGPAAKPGNRVAVSIKGDGNGGADGASFTGRPASLGLTPGSLTQSGFGNSMNVAVVGDGNTFAVAQLGNYNAVVATITGSNNQAAVSQTGVGNFASVAQTGIGNSISVQQTSW